MGTTAQRHDLRSASAVAALALAVRWYVRLRGGDYLDDAYITFRVARNVWDHGEYAYNLGDHAQASTSLAYTALCALLYGIFGGTGFAIAAGLGAVADSAAAGLITLLVMRAAPNGRAGVLAGVFYAALSTVALVTPQGLETGLYCGAIASAFCAQSYGRSRLAVAAAVAAMWLRPDGIAVAFGVLFGERLNGRALREPLLVIGFACLAMWAFQGAYFGTVVPQTVAAKGLVERSAAEQWFFFVSRFFVGGPGQLAVAAAFVLGLPAVRGASSLWPLGVWGLAYVGAFSSVGSWWPWYLPPSALAIAPWVGIGLARGTEWASKRLHREAWEGRASVVVALAVFVALSTRTVRGAEQNRASSSESHRALVEIADWLTLHSPADANVLVEPLGVVGFHLDRRFDDYPGLASPQVTAALRTLGHRVGATPADTEALRACIDQLHPTYLILRPNEREPAEEAGVLDAYRVVHRAAYADTEFTVLERSR